MIVTFCCGCSKGEGTILIAGRLVGLELVKVIEFTGSVYVWVVMVMLSRIASDMTFSRALAIAL